MMFLLRRSLVGKTCLWLKADFLEDLTTKLDCNTLSLGTVENYHVDSFSNCSLSMKLSSGSQIVELDSSDPGLLFVCIMLSVGLLKVDDSSFQPVMVYTTMIDQKGLLPEDHYVIERWDCGTCSRSIVHTSMIQPIEESTLSSVPSTTSLRLVYDWLCSELFQLLLLEGECLLPNRAVMWMQHDLTFTFADTFEFNIMKEVVVKDVTLAPHQHYIRPLEHSALDAALPTYLNVYLCTRVEKQLYWVAQGETSHSQIVRDFLLVLRDLEVRSPNHFVAALSPRVTLHSVLTWCLKVPDAETFPALPGPCELSWVPERSCSQGKNRTPPSLCPCSSGDTFVIINGKPNAESCTTVAHGGCSEPVSSLVSTTAVMNRSTQDRVYNTTFPQHHRALIPLHVSSTTSSEAALFRQSLTEIKASLDATGLDSCASWLRSFRDVLQRAVGRAENLISALDQVHLAELQAGIDVEAPDPIAAGHTPVLADIRKQTGTVLLPLPCLKNVSCSPGKEEMSPSNIGPFPAPRLDHLPVVELTKASSNEESPVHAGNARSTSAAGSGQRKRAGSSERYFRSKKFVVDHKVGTAQVSTRANQQVDPAAQMQLLLGVGVRDRHSLLSTAGGPSAPIPAKNPAPSKSCRTTNPTSSPPGAAFGHQPPPDAQQVLSLPGVTCIGVLPPVSQLSPAGVNPDLLCKGPRYTVVGQVVSKLGRCIEAETRQMQKTDTTLSSPGCDSSTFNFLSSELSSHVPCSVGSDQNIGLPTALSQSTSQRVPDFHSSSKLRQSPSSDLTGVVYRLSNILHPIKGGASSFQGVSNFSQITEAPVPAGNQRQTATSNTLDFQHQVDTTKPDPFVLDDVHRPKEESGADAMTQDTVLPTLLCESVTGSNVKAPFSGSSPDRPPLVCSSKDPSNGSSPGPLVTCSSSPIILQTKPCWQYRFIGSRCIDCWDKHTQNAMCRFMHFRKLNTAVTGRYHIKSVGFTTSDQATVSDLEPWTVAHGSPFSQSEAWFILSHIAEPFLRFLRFNLELYLTHADRLFWRRAITQIRELCDVCMTSILDFHMVCKNCGLAMCHNCIVECTEYKFCGYLKRKCYSKWIHRESQFLFVHIIPGVLARCLTDQLENVVAKHQAQLHQALHPHAPSNGIPPDHTARMGEPVVDGMARYRMLCHGRMLQLLMPADPMNYITMHPHWKASEPFLISGMQHLLNMEQWSSASFATDFGNDTETVIDCLSHTSIANYSMDLFWKGFESVAAREIGSNGERRILKLKDWPSSDDFQKKLPRRFADVMAAMPLPDYTTRNGRLNLASRLPKFFLQPDLGPKMYIAYGSALHPSTGSTRLHLDISDAVNVMVYIGQLTEGDAALHENQAVTALLRRCCDPSTLARLDQGEVPGALWHIFHPKDNSTVRNYLTLRDAKTQVKKRLTDPIHDQCIYFDEQMLGELEKDYGVQPYTICQFLGDSVFIPAGAPHQVLNLHSCIKVALDFVTPEHVDACIQLTKEFRKLSNQHNNHEDKLQILNLLFHSSRDALTSLRSSLCDSPPSSS